ncbi:hypothetical protein ACVWW2_001325 [Bradyrhizobium sp. LM4.3]
MAVDQSRGNRPRSHPLPSRAGMARPQSAQRTGAAMKTAAPPLAVAFNIVCGIAYAQSTSDSMETLGACSATKGSAQLECVQDLSPKGPPLGRRGADDSWLVSETTSPVDYSPIVTATISSVSGPNGAAMQLAIHCRKGRTEVMIAGPRALTRRQRICCLLSTQCGSANSTCGRLAVVRVWNRFGRRCRAIAEVITR